MMFKRGDLTVLILTAKVPDIVQRLEPVCGVNVELLHDLVHDAAHLQPHKNS